MRLEGLHHVTMITAHAQRTVDFHAGVLGLRMVKKTVNFDQPDAYHLYFGDEAGAPGSVLTWFEFPGAAPGAPAAGDIHLLQLGVPSAASVDFWAERLGAHGIATERVERGLAFADPDGLHLELVVADGNPPLQAVHTEVPAEHAITGIEGARAYTTGDQVAVAHDTLTDVLGFTDEDDGSYRLQGEQRHARWAYDPAPEGMRRRQGAGSVHHIAWASRDEDHLQWQAKLAEAGYGVTDVRDRDYFKAIYFREPRGVLFELATLAPGFAVDEAPKHLGEALRLPAQHERLRSYLEGALTPVTNPRAQEARA